LVIRASAKDVVWRGGVPDYEPIAAEPRRELAEIEKQLGGAW